MNDFHIDIGPSETHPGCVKIEIGVQRVTLNTGDANTLALTILHTVREIDGTLVTHAQRHGYEDDSRKVPLEPVPAGIEETGRIVLVKPETLEAIYKLEGKPAGIPVLMDANGNYFPIPPANWTP